MTTKEKRQQILGAASECLARFGYDKTTMDDIARRIGLNKTSLYYYYRNKEAIFIEVIVQEAQSFLDALRTKAVKAKGSRNQVLTYLSERFRYYQYVVNLHNLALETLRCIEPSFKALYQNGLDREIEFIGTLLQNGMDRGEIKPGPAQKTARIILTVADAIKQASCDHPDHESPETIDYSQIGEDVNYAVTLMLDGLALKPDK